MRSVAVPLLLLSAATLPLWGQFRDSDPNRKPNVFLGGQKNPKNKRPTSRDVKGVILDGANKPVDGALVTLTDTKSNKKLTFITKNDGRYNFDALSFDIDYELIAKLNRDESIVKKLSQFDRSPLIVRNLQIGADQTASKAADPVPDEPKK